MRFMNDEIYSVSLRFIEKLKNIDTCVNVLFYKRKTHLCGLLICIYTLQINAVKKIFF